ncbi:MAG: SAM-dependent methyltransferase [Ruminococcaceae bacterium]|nr:SAM-dependent methyltransferase [Oscillospiraceae bacterium]
MEMSVNALSLSHRFIAEHVHEGDLCIDATAGRGGDTAFLCGLVGDTGKVIAFDIQQEAVDSTRTLLESKGFSDRAEVHLDSHSNMDAYAQPGTVSCITYNFGWLPGGSHDIFTRAETSIAAIEKGLALLEPLGVMSLCIYYGRENGFSERDALLEYLSGLDSKVCSVLVGSFVNRPSCPPITAFIMKGR